jgi:Ca2+-binding EF-hand superfamily protein
MNPMVMRIISVFDGDDSVSDECHVTFRQFVKTLSVFHLEAPIEQKIECMCVCFFFFRRCCLQF